MGDYPDWTRLFHLVGTSITIPINIEASDIILPISIDAATVTLGVNIEASDITLPISIDAATATVGVNIEASEITMPISIDAATITLDINIASQSAYIDFTFADQSVAVFDAAKWFAHQAAQVFLWGNVEVLNNSSAIAISYTVPAGKNFFLAGVGYSIMVTGTAPKSTRAYLLVPGVASYLDFGSLAGHACVLDTPMRFTAGQEVDLLLGHYGSGTLYTMNGSMWGYLEDA